MSKVQELMEHLKCTEEEALSIIEWDEMVEKGIDPAPLTPEQEKASKQARQADHKPTVYKFTNRERKSDNDKAEIIQVIAECLMPLVGTLEVTNAEREINFVHNSRKFKIVLSAPRS